MSNNDYTKWPKVTVRFMSLLSSSLTDRITASNDWLDNNNVTHHKGDITGYFYYTLYIKDPNYMTMFMLKFGDLCDKKITPGVYVDEHY